MQEAWYMGSIGVVVAAPPDVVTGPASGAAAGGRSRGPYWGRRSSQSTQVVPVDSR